MHYLVNCLFITPRRTTGKIGDCGASRGFIQRQGAIYLYFKMGRGRHRPKSEDQWSTALWSWIHTPTQFFVSPTALSYILQASNVTSRHTQSKTTLLQKPQFSYQWRTMTLCFRCFTKGICLESTQEPPHTNSYRCAHMLTVHWRMSGIHRIFAYPRARVLYRRIYQVTLAQL